jgi:hypothetical protein
MWVAIMSQHNSNTPTITWIMRTFSQCPYPWRRLLIGKSFLAFCICSAIADETALFILALTSEDPSRLLFLALRASPDSVQQCIRFSTLETVEIFLPPLSNTSFLFGRFCLLAAVELHLSASKALIHIVSPKCLSNRV